MTAFGCETALSLDVLGLSFKQTQPDQVTTRLHAQACKQGILFLSKIAFPLQNCT